MANETQRHLYDLIKHYGTALVITRGNGGRPHARPMNVAQLKPDLEAYFATDVNSPKVAEIEADPNIAIAFQSSSEDAVVYGRATIVHDRALIHKLWSPAWKLWFPEGKDDPSICLVRFDADEGEYWDRSGIKGVKFLFEGVKALVQGRKPYVDDDPKQHSKVRVIK